MKLCTKAKLLIFFLPGVYTIQYIYLYIHILTSQSDVPSHDRALSFVMTLTSTGLGSENSDQPQRPPADW